MQNLDQIVQEEARTTTSMTTLKIGEMSTISNFVVKQAYLAIRQF
ncbi:hypothetical protein [Bacillus sp. M6-12]|nr:hypothetical protein [Bacillus sp. M6-12]